MKAQTLSLETITGQNDIQITNNLNTQKRIIMDQDPNTGKKVFVWQHDATGNGNRDIYCAVYTADMILLNQFTVNLTTNGDQAYPTIKVNPQDNSFVVAWAGFINNTNTSDPNQYDIYVKKINFLYIDRDKTVPDLLVNTNYVTGNQIAPCLTFDYLSREVIVAWIDQNGRDRLPTVVTGIDYGCYARRVRNKETYGVGSLELISGTSDFRLNDIITGHQTLLGIEISPVTRELYILSQQQNFPSGNDYDIVFRKFTRDIFGNYTGNTEVLINNVVASTQSNASMAINSTTGDYVISWNSMGSGIIGWDCFSRAYNKNNVEIKSDFKVAPFSTNNNELGPKVIWDENLGYLFYFHWYSVGGTTSIRYTVFDKTFSKIADDVFAINKNLNNYYGVTYSIRYDQNTKKVFLVYDEYANLSSSVSTGWFRQFNINFPNFYTSNTSKQNYVEEQTPYKEIKDETVLINNPNTVANINRSYLDGLERPIQEVAIGASPLKKDIVQPVEYDAFGRQTKALLPYVHSSQDGAFKNDYTTSQANFYNDNTNNNSDRIVNDLYPFSEMVFENNLPNSMSEKSAPGNSWRLNSGHTTTESIFLNQASDNIRLWVLNGTGAQSTNIYADNTLFKKISTDEMGNTTETFTNKSGKVICTKSKTFGCVTSECITETYYVYDYFENVKFVIPPKAIDEMNTTGSWSVTFNGTSNVDLMISAFVYDKRQRVIQSKFPSKALERIIFNNLNQPVLMQDGNLQASNRWNFIKYDIMGRVIITGVITDPRSITQIQNDIDTKPFYEKVSSTSTTGYTNISFPTTSELDVLAINYYDNPIVGYPYISSGLIPEPVPTLRTKGMLTGFKKRNLSDNSWLITVNFYDKDGRLIQTRNNNHKNLSVASYSTYQYDFTGSVLTKKTIMNTGIDQITTEDRYEYDHIGRMKNTFKKINSQAEVLISSLNYNEIGQIVEKNLHSDNSGTSFLQSLDYTYNIRGWLTHINNSTLSNSSIIGTPQDNNNDTNDLFGMEIVFDKVIPGVSTMYNGNITGIFWKINNAMTSTEEKSFLYTYDGFNQLTDASYGVKQSGFFQYGNAFRETGITYDKNGNIKTLQRYDASASIIDNLTYDYTNSGNQLKKTTDASSITTGFNDRTNQSGEYQYDANGNLIADLNKGITSITYNHLNLPLNVIFGPAGDNNRIEYIYDAAGAMLTKRIIKAGLVSMVSEYVDGIYYQNNTFQYFSTQDGRAVRSSSGIYSFQYFLKDHLDNIRILFEKDALTSQAVIIQENSYYPFGMKMQSFISSNDGGVNNFLFGGKEYQLGMDIDGDLVNEYDWDVYDFGARMYDPVLTRWFNPDPANQFANYTPYGYCLNNPVLNCDRDGRWIGIAIAIGAAIGIYTGYEIAESKGYDLGDIETYGYMLGGGFVGGLSGYAGANISSDGGFMANTAGIMLSSTVNSIGMNLLSGGDTQTGISFGFASFSEDDGFSYLGQKGNTTLENISYIFGAMANVQDIVAGVNGVSVLVKSRPKLAGHSQTNGSYNGKDITISVGPDVDLNPSLDGLKWEWEYVKEQFNGNTVSGENVSYIRAGQPQLVTKLNNVNGKWLQKMTENLNAGRNLIDSGPLKYGLGYGCVNFNSRALFGAGVINVNALLPVTAPVLLNFELGLRQAGIFASPYMYDEQ